MKNIKKKKKIHQEKPEKWDFRDKMIDGYSPYPSLGAYEYVRSLENIENETEKHHFNEKLDFMKKNEEKQVNETELPKIQGKQIPYLAKTDAYVLKTYVNGTESIKGVTLSENLAKKMLEDDFYGVSSYEEANVYTEDLETQEFEPFDSEGFTKIIGEQAQKTAKVSHDLEMKRIKAKLIADLCKELVKTPISYTDVPQIAREIAYKALGNI